MREKDQGGKGETGRKKKGCMGEFPPSINQTELHYNRLTEASETFLHRGKASKKAEQKTAKNREKKKTGMKKELTRDKTPQTQEPKNKRTNKKW